LSPAVMMAAHLMTKEILCLMRLKNAPPDCAGDRPSG
jgi:hypothetical protein